MRFMQGRYGMDQFGRFIAAAALFCALLSMFLRHNLFYWIALALIAYSYFRMFSRNISKRYAENVAFQKQWNKFMGKFNKQKNLWSQRRYDHIYTCPGCRQKIRIPKGKGKIEVRCPKCGETFIRKS